MYQFVCVSILTKTKRNSILNKEEYYYQLPEEFALGQTGKPIDEVTASGFPQHSIVYICADVKTDPNENYSNIKLYPMICASKVPTLLRKIPKSELNKFQDSYEIQFYIKVKEKLSALLNYISFNFDVLYDDPKI